MGQKLGSNTTHTLINDEKQETYAPHHDEKQKTYAPATMTKTGRETERERDRQC
jgi:hypothetical protein